MSAPTCLADLSDRELLAAVKRLAAEERHATAALIESLREIDARRLYLGEGSPSLFDYCTRVLHMSESAAYARIAAARTARRFPIVLEMLAAGDVTLTTLCLLTAHLTEDNHRQVLETARRMSKREVEQLVGTLHPRPDVPATIRKLPAPRALVAAVFESGVAVNGGATKAADTPGVVPAPWTPPAAPTAAPGTTTAAGARPDAIAPLHTPSASSFVVAALAPGRYKVQFTVGHATHDKLRRAQDLMRHSVPHGDPAEIFDRALTLLLEHLERTKLAHATRPRPPVGVAPGSRNVPSAVRRAVWQRDGAQCAFVGTEGRCPERGFLELHHVLPYARGGAATVDNIQLRCRAHNQYEAERDFGQRHMFVRERAPVWHASGQSIDIQACEHGPKGSSHEV